MPLTNKQKKQLKKNINKKDFESLCKDISCSKEDALGYLKKIWKPEKFDRFNNSIIQKDDKKIGKKTDSIVGLPNLSKFLDGWYVYIFLACLVFLVYINAITANFVSDDIQAIFNNQRLTEASWIFRMPLYFLRDIFYAGIVSVFGKTPLVFRFLNIGFHMGSTLMIFIILRRLENKYLAFFTATLFAVHPILIEGVTWISGGPYAQYTFFFLLSFYFYIRQKTKYDYYISIFFFLLCLLSSEKSFVTSGIFYIYEITYGGKNLLNGFKKSWPFLLLGFTWTIYYVLKLDKRYSVLSSQYYNQKTPGLVESPLKTMAVSFGKYFELLVFPKNLTLYQTKFNTGSIALIYDFLIVSAFISITVWSFFTKRKSVFFWSMFFIVPLIPFIIPLGVAWIVAERYTYLGSIAFFVGVSYLFYYLLVRFAKFKILVLTLFFVYVSVLSARTLVRNNSWRNEDKLWKATVRVSDNSPKAYNNMGDVYFRAGDLDNAIISFENAIKLHPNNADFYHNLANVYRAKEEFDTAEEYYLKALSMNPSIWQSQVNLAEIYIYQENYEKSLEYLEGSLEFTGPRIPTLLTIANIYNRLGDNEKAKFYYYEVLKVDPINIEAQNSLVGL